jgi:hypothetical protein
MSFCMHEDQETCAPSAPILNALSNARDALPKALVFWECPSRSQDTKQATESQDGAPKRLDRCGGRVVAPRIVGQRYFDLWPAGEQAIASYLRQGQLPSLCSISWTLSIITCAIELQGSCSITYLLGRRVAPGSHGQIFNSAHIQTHRTVLPIVPFRCQLCLSVVFGLYRHNILDQLGTCVL